MSDCVTRGLPATTTTSASKPCRANAPESLATQGIVCNSLVDRMATVSFCSAAGGVLALPATAALAPPLGGCASGGIAPFNAEKMSLAQAMKEKGIQLAMDVKPSSVVYLNRRGANLRIIAGWRNQQSNWVMGKPDIRDLAGLRGRLVGLKDFGSI